MLKTRTRQTAETLAHSLCLPSCSGAQAGQCAANKQPCAICRLFGAAGIEGLTYFGDLLTDTAPVLGSQDRAAVSRTRGVANQFHSQRFLIFPPDTRFVGMLHHRIPTSDHILPGLLYLALRAVDQIGTGHAVGWGQCRLNITAPANAHEWTLALNEL